MAANYSMVPEEPNSYSRQWFEFFHVGIDEARTARETDFVCRCAALPQFRRILDVCCGMGRHARVLASSGYSVTAIDRDTDAIAKARGLGDGPEYVVADIRDYRPEPGSFDAAIVMGQSFGYFDAATNRTVLQSLTSCLREGGRIILDLWNPEFFADQQGGRDLKTPRGVVNENKCIGGDRLFVQLGYPGGGHEQFGWQLFTSEQMRQLAESVGLDLVLSCMDFDKASLPSPANPRIQFVLERAT